MMRMWWDDEAIQYAPLNSPRQWPPLKTYRVREKISSGTSWNAFLSICRSNFWLSSERGSNKFWGHTLHGLIEELTMLPHQWGWPCCTNWHTHNQSRSFTCTPSVRRVKVNHIDCAEHDLALHIPLIHPLFFCRELAWTSDLLLNFFPSCWRDIGST